MLIAALLAGIVFLNVNVLELNRGIAATTAQATKLEQQNSALRSRLADVGSPEAIQRAAENLGFVLPQPGDVGYVRVRPDDSRRAASRLDSGASSSSAVSPSSAQVAPATPAPSAPVTPVAPTPAQAPPSGPGPSSTGTAAAPTGSTGTAAPTGPTGTASSTGPGAPAASGPSTAR